MIPSINMSLQENIDIITFPNKDYKIDFDKNIISSVYINDIDELKQAIYMILNTERYEYIIYDWNYGIELKDLYGLPNDYVCSEVKLRIKDALLQDDRITNVDNFDFEINVNKIKVTFIVNTIFGDISQEMEVRV